MTRLIRYYLCWGFVCFLSFSSLNAQSYSADSLYAIWQDLLLSEEQRLDAYYNRFRTLKNESKDQEVGRWVMDIHKAQELAIKLRKDQYMGRLQLVESGMYIAFLKQSEQGCPIALAAMQKNEAEEDYAAAAYAGIFSILGDCSAYELNGGSNLLNQINRLVSKLEKKGSKAELLTIYELLGILLSDLDRLPEALIYSQKNLQLAQSLELKDAEASASMTIGIIHHFSNNLPEAKKYFTQSLQLNKTLKDTLQISAAQILLAETHLKSQELSLAIQNLDSAIFIIKGIDDCVSCMAKARRINAGINNLAGRHGAAKDSLLELLSFYESPPLTLSSEISPNSIGGFYIELSRAYLGLNQYQKAIQFAQKGIDRAESIKFTQYQSYAIISQAWEGLGKYEKALKHYRTHVALGDSLSKWRNTQDVTRRELSFQYEQKRLADSLSRQQERLEQELSFQAELNHQKTNRNIGIALGIGALLVAGGLFSRLRYVRKTEAELKAKNQTIEAEKENAKASERAKHQFLANMSHEIRTPMNAIKGMTDILLRRKPAESQLKYLNGIRQSSDSLLVIINDILDLSKIEAGKIELEKVAFSVREVVTHVETIMQFKAEEKGLALKTILPENLSEVKGDPTRLRQILINLVGNAIKFTEKGMVNVSLKTEALNEGQLQYHFTVSDTGIGIDPIRLEKIFESFEQAYADTSRKFGGTGLGLSISKKLVELQGGEIWVKSTKGQGSQFHFTLLYENAQTAKDLQKTVLIEEENIAQDLKAIRILLVEDNHFNAIVAQEELEDAIEEVQVETAENGAIAVEKLRIENYDIVLMDVQMPVMNGYEATVKIRAFANGKSQTPIIAMTANVMQEEVDRCYAAGMDDFIGKPFDIDDLLQKISNQVNSSRQSPHD